MSYQTCGQLFDLYCDKQFLSIQMMVGGVCPYK